MKKISFIILALGLVFFGITSKINAQSKFHQAIKTCENYSLQGSVEHNREIFNILVTLEKKQDKCVYKEKIFQGKNYQMLTCNFEKAQLPFLSSSMERFNNTFTKEIAKNNIFEAKMSTNGEIFQKYLVDKKYCQITHSKK